MSQPCLFPEIEQARRGGENTLTEPEREGLVLGVLDWCRRLARDHAETLAQCGRRPEADDLIQEAFLAATEAARYYHADRGTRFTTFVKPWVQIHLTAVTDRRLVVPMGAMEHPESVKDRDDGPEAIEPDEPDAGERRLLGNLPEPCRTIVRLSVFDGLGPDRIAAQLGLAVKDVKLMMRNGAARLGRALDSDGDFDGMAAASGN
jgi:RNA polymerase sigma factor (sigma-70 family)